MRLDDVDDLLREHFECAPVAASSREQIRQLERALCLLKFDDPEAHQIVQCHYQNRRSLRWMEYRGMGCRRSLARKLAEGMQFLRGYLSATTRRPVTGS